LPKNPVVIWDRLTNCHLFILKPTAMGTLAIFQHADGTMAWDNLSILALVFLSGWLLQRYATRRAMNRQHEEDLAAQEVKLKRLENEYKNYRANIGSTEKHNEKAVIELNGRVRALEGDIRVLAEEKREMHHQLAEKEQEIRRYVLQVGERDDRVAALRESRAKVEEDLTARLNHVSQALAKALVWEAKAKAAETEAARARESIGQAERKKLEAELRLKSVTEYAGKVTPLEHELAAREQMIAGLLEKIRSAEGLTERLNSVSAELESLRASWQKL
jgi:ParB family transcriptional regulator, chromosome partitioning protein